MTGQPFLTTKLTGYRVALEVAWGADLTAFTGSTWTWTDITTDVMLKGEDRISITLGRPDFSSETQTAEMVCVLDNRASAYSEGGLSANWPNIRRGTPVRLRVSTDSGSTWKVRFQGAANGFTPRWDEATGRWATVELSASGPLRRLNQGTGVGISAMREGTLADSSVVAYVPCEDRQHTTLVAPAVGPAGGLWKVMDQATDTVVDGSPGECASYNDIASSGPIVTLGEGGGFQWDVPDTLTTTAVTFTGFFANVPSLKPYDGVAKNKFGTDQIGNVFVIWTGGSAIKAWAVTVWTGGSLWLSCYNADPFFYHTSMIIDQKVSFNLKDNTPYEIGLSLSQSGTTTNYRLFTRQLGTTDGLSWVGSKTSNSNGAVVQAVDSGLIGDSQGLSLGHFVLRNTIVNELYDSDWANGYPGESVTARMTRLCNNHDIALTVLGSSVAISASVTDYMGPQYYDTLTNLLRECEATGQGALYDGLGPGLTYVTKRRREDNASGAATLVIDASAGQLMVPFQPVDDDQQTTNHCDVSRRSGTNTTYSDLTGPMGVNTIGDYSTSITPNPETDDGLVGYAQWLVHRGTQTGYRYPTISFALETNPALIAGWLACTPQARVDVTNVASVRTQHPNETIKLLLEGWHEEISAFTWRVTANTSSAVPWNVVVLAAATGSTGDGICHLDTDGSQLNTSVSAGATSISVKTNTGPLWVTTAGDADSFPFDIDIGGIKATVTAISGASSPQTFTLSAGLPRALTGSTTVGAGVPITVWRPPVFGL